MFQSVDYDCHYRLDILVVGYRRKLSLAHIIHIASSQGAHAASVLHGASAGRCEPGGLVSWRRWASGISNEQRVATSPRICHGLCGVVPRVQ